MDLEGSDRPFAGPRRMGEFDDSTVTRQPTLRDVRAALISLATGDGRYTIVCGRTGTRPVPVSGLRFADRETAASGVRLAETYRAHLRQYDPRLPVHEFVVHETTSSVTSDASAWRRRPGATPVPVRPTERLANQSGFEGRVTGDDRR